MRSRPVRREEEPEAPRAPKGQGRRTQLLTELTERQSTRAHDTFTIGTGLGMHAGNVYALIRTTAVLEDNRTLHILHRHGLTR